VGEKISPVCCTELEDAPGIASVMIALDDDYAINLFRLPFSSHSHTRDAGERIPGMVGSRVTAHPIISGYHYLDATSGLRTRSEGSPPGGRKASVVTRSCSTAAKVRTLRSFLTSHPRILVNHQRLSAAVTPDSPMISPTFFRRRTPSPIHESKMRIHPLLRAN